jgi:hypothetical protein
MKRHLKNKREYTFTKNAYKAYMVSHTKIGRVQADILCGLRKNTGVEFKLKKGVFNIKLMVGVLIKKCVHGKKRSSYEDIGQHNVRFFLKIVGIYISLKTCLGV